MQRDNKLVQDNAVSLDLNNYPEGQNSAGQGNLADVKKNVEPNAETIKQNKLEQERWAKQT